MNKTLIHSVFALLALISVGCASSPQNLRVESADFRPRTTTPEKIILKTNGDPGQQFQGHLLIDGVKHPITATSPAQFPLEAIILIGEFRKTEGSGTLSFTIENVPKTRSAGFGTLKKPGDICRFGYHDGGIETYSR